jgi:hypothetical protein
MARTQQPPRANTQLGAAMRNKGRPPEKLEATAYALVSTASCTARSQTTRQRCAVEVCAEFLRKALAGREKRLPAGRTLPLHCAKSTVTEGEINRKLQAPLSHLQVGS